MTAIWDCDGTVFAASGATGGTLRTHRLGRGVVDRLEPTG